jgi:hypothetical protein
MSNTAPPKTQHRKLKDEQHRPHKNTTQKTKKMSNTVPPKTQHRKLKR